MVTVAEAPAAVAAEDPERVAGGEPRNYIGALPVYWWGQAPRYLRTQPQLNRARLKVAEGQAVVAYVHTREWGAVALYDPAGAEKMRPLASKVKQRMEARRTCPQCGEVGEYVVRGGRCGDCERRDYEARQRLLARTCWDCKAVRERPYPQAHGRCRDCRRTQLAEDRARAKEALLYNVTCPGRGCEVRTASTAEYRRWEAANPHGYWRSRWCPPCAERDGRERAEAIERAERAREAKVEARRRQVAGLERWAADALADELVCVLDTETTGLDADSCIVEIAVQTVRGEVLLSSLVNPGCPIPPAATDVHGITDAMVSGAPSFGELLDGLAQALAGRRCLIYNEPFDVGRLRWELTRHYRAAGHEDAEGAAAAWLAGAVTEDVMVPYSDWVGAWDAYWGNNAWQRLPGGGHRALGDCQAVVDVLRSMARGAEDEMAAAETRGQDSGEGV